MLANVKIEQNEEKRPYFRVYKDGQVFTMVRHIDANFDVDEIPTVNVEIVGGFDFEGMADIHFDYSPQTVKEACKILREELFRHGDLYIALWQASSHLSENRKQPHFRSNRKETLRIRFYRELSGRTDYVSNYLLMVAWYSAVSSNMVLCAFRNKRVCKTDFVWN